MYELCKKSLLLEREHWKINQYTRRNNIEIAGIPENIKNEVLEDTVVKILDKIGVKCDPTVIEACHRLPRNRRPKVCNTIVRFVNRKTAEKSLMYRKNLKSIDLSDIDESFKESKVFVNDNLRPYYKGIYGKCRSLYNAGKINSFWSWKGEIFIKLSESSNKIGISHDQDLVERFADFDFSRPS